MPKTKLADHYNEMLSNKEVSLSCKDRGGFFLLEICSVEAVAKQLS